MMASGRIGAADRRLALRLFFALWAIYGFIGPGWTMANPNTITRIGFVFSALDHHSARIDAYAELTVDKAMLDGRTFMDKAPGVSLMALPAVAVAQFAGRLAGADVSPLEDGHLTGFYAIACLVSVVFTAACFCAAGAAALFLLARRLGAGVGAALFAALGYALCTPAFGWATTLFSHAIAGAFLLIGFAGVLLASETQAPGRRREWLAVVAGGVLGWAIVIEFTSGLAVLVIGGIGLWRLRTMPRAAMLRVAGLALLGGLAALVPLGLYNFWAFGSPTHLGYSDVVGFGGMQRGFFGISLPRPSIMLKLLAGERRGILWIAPLLLLMPLAWAAAWRRLPREIALATVVIPVSYLLINSGYAYWDGGLSVGPRHIIPGMPFLALALAPLWEQAGRRARRAMLALAGLSFALSLLCALTIMTPPVWSQFPLVDFLAPEMLRGRLHSVLMIVGIPGIMALPVLMAIAALASRGVWPEFPRPSFGWGRIAEPKISP